MSLIPNIYIFKPDQNANNTMIKNNNLNKKSVATQIFRDIVVFI